MSFLNGKIIAGCVFIYVHANCCQALMLTGVINDHLPDSGSITSPPVLTTSILVPSFKVDAVTACILLLTVSHRLSLCSCLPLTDSVRLSSLPTQRPRPKWERAGVSRLARIVTVCVCCSWLPALLPLYPFIYFTMNSHGFSFGHLSVCEREFVGDREGRKHSFTADKHVQNSCNSSLWWVSCFMKDHVGTVVPFFLGAPLYSRKVRTPATPKQTQHNLTLNLHSKYIIQNVDEDECRRFEDGYL